MIKGIYKTTLTSLILILIIESTFSLSSLTSLLPQIESTIHQAKNNLWSQMDPQTYLWNIPSHYGSSLLSQYYFQLKIFNLNQTESFQTKFNQTYFTQKLITQQLSDGSWKQIVDENKKQGDLDATIMNYYYLKDIGIGELSQTMLNARKFILKKGGIQKTKIFTKYKLAMLGQYQWHLVNYIPLFLFQNKFPFYSYAYIKDYVSQQTYPYLLAFAYFRYHKSIFIVSNTCLSELMNARGSPPCTYTTTNDTHKFFNKLNASSLLTPDASVDNLLNEAIKLYSPSGTFGGTTTNTILTLIALKDYTLRYNQSQTDNFFSVIYNNRFKKSLQFIESMYFNKYSSYLGAIHDGRYWDSLLAIFTLLESNEQLQRLLPSINSIEKEAQHKNKGITFGLGFDYSPDTDSTAILLSIYKKMQQYYKEGAYYNAYDKKAKELLEWISNIQNEDGGFPKFDKNKNDGQYKFLKVILWLTQIDKSIQVFDPSSVDITGHVLQALGIQYSLNNQTIIMSAIQYLLNSRKDDMWNSRWGINQIHAIGAIYTGLSKIGFDMNSSLLANTTNKILQMQQEDGGFGQSSDSQNLGRYIRGSSTVTMTAWGLLSYLQIAHTFNNKTLIDSKIQKSVRYIMNNLKYYGKFYDVSVVGTAHRGISNIQYPIYAYTYPLLALSRFKRYVLQVKQKFINIQLMNKVYNATKGPQDQL